MAWPALKNFFILQTRDTVNVAPQVTLRSLQLLAKHCSALTQLLISVDATAVPAYATLPSLLRSSLRNLVLLDSICGAVDDVATFLQCTFPGLPRLLATEWLQDVPTRYPTQSSGKWVDVSSRMPSLEPWNVDLNLRIGTNFNALK